MLRTMRTSDVAAQKRALFGGNSHVEKAQKKEKGYLEKDCHPGKLNKLDIKHIYLMLVLVVHGQTQNNGMDASEMNASVTIPTG